MKVAESYPEAYIDFFLLHSTQFRYVAISGSGSEFEVTIKTMS